MRRLHRQETGSDSAPTEDQLEAWTIEKGFDRLGYSSLLDMIAPDSAIRREMLAAVQAALDRLVADGEVAISVRSVGHRSAFVGAVLLMLPGTRAVRSTPPRVVLTDGGGELDRGREAGAINAWWRDDPGERYWLEITDRPDPGVDLDAPQRDATGNPTPGYSLLWWVLRGDVVFHYERREQAITS